MENETWAKNIDQIIDWVLESYQKPNNNIFARKIAEFEQKTIYAIIDRETKEWIFLDDRKLVERMKEIMKSDDD